MNKIVLSKYLWLVSLFFLISHILFSQENTPGFNGSKKLFAKDEKKIQFSCLWQHENLKPDQNTNLALVIDFIKNHHINPPAHLIPPSYPIEVIATKIKVSKITDHAVAQSPIFLEPKSERSEELKFDQKFYKDQTTVFIPIKIKPSFTAEKLEVTIEVYYQLCNDKVCFAPKTETITTEIIVNKNGELKAINESIFSQIPKATIALSSQKEESFGFSKWSFKFDGKTKLGFFLMVVMAFFGGVLLNFTPCVLPIIPIKMMGLTTTAGTRRKSIFLGVVMSLGILSFWLFIALLVSSVPKFSSVSKLFQYTEFTITIGVIIAIMAIGMCGLFDFRVPQKLASINPRFSSTFGSFGIGVMTAILSSPCAGPFMGSAMVWALQQSQSTTLLIFFTIGMGMAFPYLILSSFPNLVSWVPRSGPGSVVIKQTMGILMLAAASYFIGIGLTASVKAFHGSSNHWWPTMSIAAFAGIWVIIKTIQLNPSGFKKGIFLLLGLAISSVSLLILVAMIQVGPLVWKEFTPELLSKAKDENKTFVLDFTAEWCPNCKTLEKFVLNSKEVSDALMQLNAELIKVDITNEDELKTKLLNEEGSLTIPYLVIYKNGQKVFQADFYSKEDLLKIINVK